MKVVIKVFLMYQNTTPTTQGDQIGLGKEDG